jgi:hypothetical protein
MRADSPTRDKECASTRGREAGLEGGKRGWRARGSGGGVGVAVNARRSGGGGNGGGEGRGARSGTQIGSVRLMDHSAGRDGRRL